ncbi:hypothetical protein SAMD00019534_048010 [Acytostelium subglobosum LB1]|uniref:hypothetical protein n=1 Tax=Acytostelium subglobosum LB1 TaxID=1410327 RepID=UPI000645124B|nr:hypothetical protein SAMD00019534_048010 [Acytostelium subglobosum LB1]GAM21626.1 hypothetical protein SAMD00019534_048010 [Acytostelium subglobosum LB1]|eukprot:XP_012755745.1 hypothetical protein SAMD00019534_048010 [Acytostelium subglobosum LB1]
MMAAARKALPVATTTTTVAAGTTHQHQHQQQHHHEKPIPPPIKPRQRPMSAPINEGVAITSSTEQSPSSSEQSPTSSSPPRFRLPSKSNSSQFSTVYDKSNLGLKTIDEDDMLHRPNLQKVILSKNNLESVPTRICELGSISSLDLSYNRLTHLPVSLASMPELNTLLLAGNQFLVAATSTEDSEDDHIDDQLQQQQHVNTTTHNRINFGGNSSGNVNVNVNVNGVVDLSTLKNSSFSDLSSEKTTPRSPKDDKEPLSFIAMSTDTSDLMDDGFNSVVGQQHVDTSPVNSEPIPSELSYLKSLRVLDLSSNIAPGWCGPTYLPPSIFWFGQITTLLVTHAQLKAIPADIHHLCSLTHLDLSNNLIDYLPTEVGLLANLQQLSVRDNKLDALPLDLGRLTKLTHLDVSKNALADLPAELSKLVALEILDISFNQLAKLPEQLFQERQGLVSLKDFRMRRNNIERLPPMFFRTRCRFEHLDLSENGLSDLPPIPSADDGESLSGLSTLILFSNRLTSLPRPLLQTSLTMLNASGNNITSVPPTLWIDTPALSHLLLGYNKLKTLPLPSSPFYNLEELYLNGNDHIGFRDTSDNVCFPSLSNVGLASCMLKAIPDFLYRCELIDQIDLSYNELTSIDDRLVDSFENLSVLLLSHNKLTQLPNELEQLKHLIMLDVSFNCITTIPHDLFSHTSSRSNQLHLTHHHNDSDLSATFGESCDTWYDSDRFAISMAETMGRRPTMEDAFTIRGNMAATGSANKTDLIAMFDGHAGAMAATYSCKWLPKIVKSLIDKYPSLPPLQWIRQAYSEINAHFKNYIATNTDRPELRFCGATAATVLLHNNHCYVSNIGDSRVVLCRGGQAQRLSFDHKPNDPHEEDRIRKLGGFVVSNQHTARVNGVLAVSRSIGDFYMEPFVISDPYLSITQLQPDDQFLIIACDGIWDEIEDQTACEVVLGAPSLAHAASRLRDYAYFKGSDDNITVIVVDLRPTQSTS